MPIFCLFACGFSHYHVIRINILGMVVGHGYAPRSSIGQTPFMFFVQEEVNILQFSPSYRLSDLHIFDIIYWLHTHSILN